MRTNEIYAVTVARYATMFVEASSVQEAMKFAEEHCDEVDDFDYFECDSEVSSCDSYSTELASYMDAIWTKDGKLTYYEYKDQLDDE